MNIHHRLRSLERAALPAAPAACPGCGGGSGPPRYRLLPLEWDGAGNQVRHATGPETCPGCGRRLVIRMLPITIDEK